MTTDPTAPATPAEALDLDAIEARAEAARQHVYKLCSGEERWTLRVPAQPDRDSDFLLDAALGDIPALVAELRQVRGETLRWAAERVNELMGGGTDLGATLSQWADELDAARATDPAPATPPEHQPGVRTYELPDEPDGPLWDRYGRQWTKRAGGKIWRSGGHLAPWYELLAQVAPLSSTPPAGTDSASATAVDPPAGTVTA